MQLLASTVRRPMQAGILFIPVLELSRSYPCFSLKALDLWGGAALKQSCLKSYAKVRCCDPLSLIFSHCKAHDMLHPHVNRILPAAEVRRNHLAESSTRQPTSEVQDIDEDASPNRLRREVSEGSIAVLPKRALLRCRRPVIMASFNANTARTDEDAIEIAYCAESCGIDILGIQKHRRVHDEDQKEDIKFEKLESYHLLTSSAWTNESQAS